MYLTLFVSMLNQRLSRQLFKSYSILTIRTSLLIKEHVTHNIPFFESMRKKNKVKKTNHPGQRYVKPYVSFRVTGSWLLILSSTWKYTR